MNERTVNLGILDLLPGSDTDHGAAMRYELRDGDPVRLLGASLVTEKTETSLPRFVPIQMPSRFDLVRRQAHHAVNRMQRSGWANTVSRLSWAAEAELRRTPAIVRGIARDLRRAARDRVPPSTLAGTFMAGAVSMLLLGWIF